MYHAWQSLWIGDGEFVVVYGDDSIDGREHYFGVSAIVAFISAAKEKIRATKFLNDNVYTIENGNGDFICCFDIRITMIDDKVYENRIICRFETQAGKIARIVEYAHPLRRTRFVEHLSRLRG